MGGLAVTTQGVRRAQQKLLAGKEITAAERAAIREALEQEALESLPARIQNLYRSDRLIVSEFVDELLDGTRQHQEDAELQRRHQDDQLDHEAQEEEREELTQPQQGQDRPTGIGARGEDGSGEAPIADEDLPRAALHGRNLGREMRERWDRVQEQDAIDPPAPEDGA